MGIVIIVQARMNSTRLPGKVMKHVLGKPLLFYLVERLRRVKKVQKLVIATTKSREDWSIVDFCRRHRISCFCGDEKNVLSRYYEAAQAFSASAVVRITADCPLMDPSIIDRVVSVYFQNGQYDYVSNTCNRTYPRGMDVEIFSWETLNETFKRALTKSEKEHVTAYMYQNPQKFRLGDVVLKEDLSSMRWTVDTSEDFSFVRKVIESLYPCKKYFTMNDILELLKKRPELKKLNIHVKQKLLG